MKIVIDDMPAHKEQCLFYDGNYAIGSHRCKIKQFLYGSQCQNINCEHRVVQRSINNGIGGIARATCPYLTEKE